MREIQEFGGFRLDVGRRRLERTGGELVELGTKPFDGLVFLVEHAGEPVSRKALIDALWPDTIVEENNLTQVVSALRRVLGEGYIVTLSGRGYQFVGEVKSAGHDAPGTDAREESTAAPHFDRGMTDRDLRQGSPEEPTGSAENALGGWRAGSLERPRVPVAARHSIGPQRAVAAADKKAGSPPFWRRALPVAAAFVLGTVATGLTMWFVAQSSTPALARFDVTPDDGLTVFAADPSVAVSPDGQSFAYTGKLFELRVRRLDRLGSTTLADRGVSAFFSPDGTQIGFETGTVDDMVLKRVSIEGGPAAMITKLPRPLRGASWGADGTIVYGTVDTGSGLWRVRAAGGEPEMLTKPDPENGVVDHRWPEILPGGKAVVFTMVGASEQGSKIAVLSLATGKQRVLLRGGVSPHYSPTGHLLFGRAGTLFAVRFDAARLQIEGEPVAVQRGVMTKGDAVGTTEASLASNGTLLYLSSFQTAAAERRLYRVDAETGHETPVPLPPRAYDQVVLSPDGTHAALGIKGDKAVWFADLDRGTLDRLPADLGDKEPSVLFFSADGRRVASSATRDGRQAVVWQPIDGTGATEPLAAFDASVREVRDGALSPDGMRFAPTVMRGDTGADLGVVTIGDPDSYQDFLATAAQAYGAAISPDGHWIAYSYFYADTFRVYVQRFPEGGGRHQVSAEGGVEPHWSADGNALTYLRVKPLAIPVAMVRVPVMGLGGSDPSPLFGTPQELFPWKYFFAFGGNHFDMTADGKHLFVITTGSQDDKANQLILVQNWSEELERLVPRK